MASLGLILAGLLGAQGEAPADIISAGLVWAVGTAYWGFGGLCLGVAHV